MNLDEESKIQTASLEDALNKYESELEIKNQISSDNAKNNGPQSRPQFSYMNSVQQLQFL